MLTPVFTPAETVSGSTLKKLLQTSSKVCVRGGTALQRQAPLISPGWTPFRGRMLETSWLYSSPSRLGSVEILHVETRCSPLNTPSVTLVLPISIASSIWFTPNAAGLACVVRHNYRVHFPIRQRSVMGVHIAKDT